VPDRSAPAAADCLRPVVCAFSTRHPARKGTSWDAVAHACSIAAAKFQGPSPWRRLCFLSLVPIAITHPSRCQGASRDACRGHRPGIAGQYAGRKMAGGTAGRETSDGAGRRLGMRQATPPSRQIISERTYDHHDQHGSRTSRRRRSREARSFRTPAGSSPVANEGGAPVGQTPAQPAAHCGAHVKLHSNSA
jgi:hypothetical protein